MSQRSLFGVAAVCVVVVTATYVAQVVATTRGVLDHLRRCERAAVHLASSSIDEEEAAARAFRERETRCDYLIWGRDRCVLKAGHDGACHAVVS